MANLLGIDIGNRYTKVVEIEPKPAFKLRSCIIFETPYLPSGQSGKKEINKEVFWTEMTKHIPLKNLRSANIAVSLPSTSITAITLLLPKAAKNELILMAQAEARRKMIPASTPDHIFESVVVAARIINKITRFEVLVARAEKFYIQQLLGLFKNIDIIPKVITISGAAFSATFNEEILNKKDVDTAFVDIGISSINTAIFREGKLNFFRNTACGLQDIIQEISSNLSLSESRADIVIKDKGVPEVDFDLKNKVAVVEEIMRQKYEAGLKAQETNQKEEINVLELRMLWQGYRDRIIHEIRRSLSYYNEQTSGRRIEYIFFAGGGSQIKNLVNFLSKEIGGKCQISFPFKDMPVSQENVTMPDINSTAIFTDAVSLALSLPAIISKGGDTINFLPRELKRKNVIAAWRFILLIAGISIIAILVLLLLSAVIKRPLIQKQIKQVDTDLSRIKNIAGALRYLDETDARIKQRSSQIQEITAKRKNFSSVLDKLNTAASKEILLTKVSIYGAGAQLAAGMPPTEEASAANPGAAPDNYKIDIKAEVSADYETAIKIIDDFKTRLQAAAIFNNIKVTALKLESISTYQSGGPDQELLLTLPQSRAFTVTAYIVFEK